MRTTQYNCFGGQVMMVAFTVFCFLASLAGPALGADLPEVKASGVLRHIGVPYANFVTGGGDGLDVDLMKLFAKRLGVQYVYVETSWPKVIEDISGKTFHRVGESIEITGSTKALGDIAASGVTILPWREKIVDFSTPTFPNQVWLAARSDSRLQPITPSGDMLKDVEMVKSRLKDITVLGISGTCIDPKLYGIPEVGAIARNFDGKLNEMVPAVINGDAETALLDVPDILISMEKWPGRFKIIGPISEMQNMGCAFSKESPKLREAFNSFFKECLDNGVYAGLLNKYYPAIMQMYPDFFPQANH